MAGDDTSKHGIFEGFSSPRFTQTPNTIFDVLMPTLGEAELKVLLYIVRRTWGFSGREMGDAISLSQLCNGIVTGEGTRLDYGTGLSKSGATKALLSLRKRGIIVRIKNRDQKRGDLPTTYRLRMVNEPVDAEEEPPEELSETLLVPLSTTVDTPVYVGGHPVATGENTPVHADQQAVSTVVDTQHKDVQEKVNEKKEARILEISNDHAAKESISDIREALVPYIEDFAREFNDEAPLPSSVSRAVNLCRRAGVGVDDFIAHMYKARSTTKERNASIRAETTSVGGWNRKLGMPYFFGVLEDLLGLRKDKDKLA